MAGRAVHACPSCQQLRGLAEAELAPARRRALSQACARAQRKRRWQDAQPDGASLCDPPCGDLQPGARPRKARVLPSGGPSADAPAEQPPAPQPARAWRRRLGVGAQPAQPAAGPARPGTAHLAMASAQAAAAEKTAAGEARSVEHVALADEGSERLRLAARALWACGRFAAPLSQGAAGLVLEL
ncbi:unnamed protein product [Prorocentrum cordatum]|uniref:Uncharacterized protein n=1 Tax=Prorocentrum cordatum TaxID=2364126 RepID=A0ABN9R291_9DINO|nr:unnamed protein product [Polarella glacialis]